MGTSNNSKTGETAQIPVTAPQAIEAGQIQRGTDTMFRPHPFTRPINSSAEIVRLAFSVKETARILGVSTKTVRRLICRGLLKPSKALRHLLIPKREIERFLDHTSA